MAKTAKELIREAVKRARDDWTGYVISQERKIYELFEQASNQLVAQISKFTIEGKIPPIRLKLLLKQIQSEMNILRPRLKGIIRRSQSKSIDYGLKASIFGAQAIIPKNFKAGIGTSFIDKSGNIRRYDAKKTILAGSTWARINKQAMEALIKTKYGGITFSRRIWDVTWPVERQIRNQINLAVLTGTSADTVSRSIRSYLGLPETFRGIAFKDFHPGVGVYKSAYKNALRLSGTEINRAFSEGVFRYGKAKKWVTGYIWRIGSGNPCPDCLDSSDIFFPKGEPPVIPLHPFCYCYPEIVYEGK